MDAKIELTKIAIGGAISTVLRYLGANYRLVVLLLVLMVVDTLLGWLGAIKNGTWKSKNARWGAVGKLVELIIIALMYLCEWVFAIDWLIGTVTLYFVLCEGASIIENIAGNHLNENIPSALADILSKAKKNFVSNLIKRVKNIFEGDDNE